MATIDKLTVEKIKDAANIVDVIGDFYDLKKKGVNYECLCPFHDDRHLGSFKISPKKNTYSCYSCGAHGNSVDFLMAKQGLSYPDALRWLAKKYSIVIPEDEKENIYKAYSKMAPEEFEAKILRELEEEAEGSYEISSSEILIGKFSDKPADFDKDEP